MGVQCEEELPTCDVPQLEARLQRVSDHVHHALCKSSFSICDVCVCVFVCVTARVSVYLYVCMYSCVCMCVYMSACICVCVSQCVTLKIETLFNNTRQYKFSIKLSFSSIGHFMFTNT